MARICLRMIVLAGVVAMLATSARAELIFTADLSGLSEVGPNASPGTGFAKVVLNAAETAFTVDLSFADLSGPEIAAHIHGFSPPGVNSGVLYPLPLGAFSGQVISLADLGLGKSIAEQVTALKAGLLYVNVHTQNFPGGEIRGQLNAVPEPSSIILAIVCSLCFFGYCFRQGHQSFATHVLPLNR